MSADSMDNVDELVRRLRARMKGSASRERSLDWRAADAIEALQARVVELEQEKARHHGEHALQPYAFVDSGTTPKPSAPRETPVSSQCALSIREAANLLSVSYATVYTRKNELGFFKIGGIWRVWLNDIKDATATLSKQPQAPTAQDDRTRSAGPIPHLQERSAMLKIQRQYEELTRPRSQRQRKTGQ